MPGKLYLGIDGGQSSTIAVIGNAAGRILGEGKAGPCNHVGASEGRARFFTAVGDSVGQALRSAGEGSDTVFAAVCAGFSGGAADKDALTRELIRAERYLITHDAVIALCGATAGSPGVITIAGTGSIAYGRNSRGQTARAGGWGYVFGDEGSAFDLVRQALRAALRAEEGWGQPTALGAALIAAAGAANIDEVLHRFYTAGWPRERVASLAPLVDEAARSGDPVAGDLLSAAAQSLAALTAAARHPLFGAGQAVEVHYSGGVFSSQPLLERFRMLVELGGGASVAPPLSGPARGALLEAYRIGGVDPLPALR